MNILIILVFYSVYTKIVSIFALSMNHKDNRLKVDFKDKFLEMM